jgi:mono/diheme cytochrome c family protein
MNSGSSAKTRVAAFGTALAFVCLGHFNGVWAQEPGEQTFQVACAACHTIGGGRLVGPDLAGIHDRRSQAWLEHFVKSPKSLVDSGDSDAVAIFEEYNQLVMPDAFITDEQIIEVLAYLKVASSGLAASGGESTAASAAIESVELTPASEEEIFKGQELFQGNIRFANGGAACNACHDVRNDAVIGGGILAAELTTVFSRMGRSGVEAILGQAPFPVMQAAYQDQALTEEEVTSLVSFLEYADSEQYYQLPRDYGLGLFVSGLVGAAILFIIFSVIWRGRKSGSVYQEIYDRQIKSVSDKSG